MTPLQRWHRFGLIWRNIGQRMRLWTLPSDDGWIDATRSNIAEQEGRVYNVDPKNVQITFNGVTLRGFADGPIETAPEDVLEVPHAPVNGRFTGQITITLLQTARRPDPQTGR